MKMKTLKIFIILLFLQIMPCITSDESIEKKFKEFKNKIKVHFWPSNLAAYIGKRRLLAQIENIKIQRGICENLAGFLAMKRRNTRNANFDKFPNSFTTTNAIPI